MCGEKISDETKDSKIAGCVKELLAETWCERLGVGD